MAVARLARTVEGLARTAAAKQGGLLRHRDALDLEWVGVIDHARFQTSKRLCGVASNLGAAHNHVMHLVRAISQSQRAL